MLLAKASVLDLEKAQGHLAKGLVILESVGSEGGSDDGGDDGASKDIRHDDDGGGGSDGSSECDESARGGAHDEEASSSHIDGSQSGGDARAGDASDEMAASVRGDMRRMRLRLVQTTLCLCARQVRLNADSESLTLNLMPRLFGLSPLHRNESA
jgi:hypothetical protein